MAHQYKLSKELREALDALRVEMANLNVAVERAETEARDETGAHDEAWNEASERWQDSERGVAVAEWNGQIETIADGLDELGTLLDTIAGNIDDLTDKPEN